MNNSLQNINRMPPFFLIKIYYGFLHENIFLQGPLMSSCVPLENWNLAWPLLPSSYSKHSVSCYNSIGPLLPMGLMQMCCCEMRSKASFPKYSPWGVWTLGHQLTCSSNSQARRVFHLLASWLHLCLRKDKELCSGNMSLCTQALFLSSWWTGMEGMHLLVGIRWCPGINGSHVLICPLSALGKTLW